MMLVNGMIAELTGISLFVIREPPDNDEPRFGLGHWAVIGKIDDLIAGRYAQIRCRSRPNAATCNEGKDKSSNRAKKYRAPEHELHCSGFSLRHSRVRSILSRLFTAVFTCGSGCKTGCDLGLESLITNSNVYDPREECSLDRLAFFYNETPIYDERFHILTEA